MIRPDAPISYKVIQQVLNEDNLWVTIGNLLQKRTANIFGHTYDLQNYTYDIKFIST